MEKLWRNNNRGRTQGFLQWKDDKHKHGVGFLVHKDIVNAVMECRPVSSTLITIHLRAVPFNITIVQVYASASDYDDNEIEEWKLARHLWTLLEFATFNDDDDLQ